jgi:hypothetical protein
VSRRSVRFGWMLLKKDLTLGRELNASLQRHGTLGNVSRLDRVDEMASFGFRLVRADQNSYALWKGDAPAVRPPRAVEI